METPDKTIELELHRIEEEHEEAPTHVLEVLMSVIENDKYGHEIHLAGVDESSYEPLNSVGGSNSSRLARTDEEQQEEAGYPFQA